MVNVVISVCNERVISRIVILIIRAYEKLIETSVRVYIFDTFSEISIEANYPMFNPLIYENNQDTRMKKEERLQEIGIDGGKESEILNFMG